MRKALLAFLLIPLIVRGQFDFGDPASLALLLPKSSTPPFFIETFDATGYDLAGWVENGGTILDEDFTPAIVSGQSLKLFHAFNSLSVSNYLGGTYGTLYAKFAATMVSSAGSATFFYLRAGVSNRLRVTWGADERLTVYNGTGNATGANTFSDGTLYWFWTYYDSTTHISRLWVNTTDTKPGTVECEVTSGGDGDPDIQSVWFGGNAGGWHMVVDSLSVSTSPIP